MAEATEVPGAMGVIKFLAEGDTYSKPCRVRGYCVSHSAVTLLQLAGSATGTMANSGILSIRIVANRTGQTVMFPKGQEITCPNGLKLVKKGTAAVSFYVYV